MKIGFFDSGIGGLTALADAAVLYKDCDFVYYGDTLHAPYGTKTREQVLDYTLRAAKVLSEEGIDALVIACNTATSVAVRALRDIYSFPVIGMEPALKPALSSCDGNVLVLATDLTLKETKFNYLVEKFDAQDRVFRLPMGQLVHFAESGDFSSEKVIKYISSQLQTIDMSGVDSVVLGCTHFLYFKSTISKLLPKGVQIFDGNLGTIKNAARLTGIELSNEPHLPDINRITFYMSGVLLDDHCLNYFNFVDSIKKYLGGEKHV